MDAVGEDMREAGVEEDTGDRERWRARKGCGDPELGCAERIRKKRIYSIFIQFITCEL